MFAKYLKNPSFTLIFISCLVFSLLLNYFFSTRFEENDDVVMLLISSGKYSGFVDNHLVFINFIFGTILNFFYRFSTEIEWYTISFVVLNSLAISLLAKVIFRLSYSNIFKIVLLIFLFSVFINLSVALQFTRTATILSIAGLSVIYNTRHKYVGALVFVFGSLLRFEAAILILLLSSPLLFSEISLKNITLSKSLRVILLTVSVSIFCKVSDYAYYYTNSDWKNYMEYNKLRGKINDNPNGNIGGFQLPKNILLEDYKLLFESHTNLSAISITELQQIYQSIDERSLSSKILNCKKMIEKYWKYLLLAFSITILFFYQNSKNRIVIAATFLVFISLAIFISLDATFKPRVFYPSFFSVILFLSYLNETRNFGRINLTICILIVGFSVSLLMDSYRLERKSEQLAIRFKNKLEMVNKYLKGNKKLTPFGAQLRMNHCDPFKISSAFPTQKIFFGGWLTNIPFNKDKFDSFKYYTTGYGLLTSNKNAELESNLIAASIFKQIKIKVTPVTKFENEYNKIVEFRVDSTQSFKN